MKMNSARGNYMGTTMAARPLRLQDMLKTAMAESSRRVNVGLEAARQMDEPVLEKTASASAGAVDSEYALKLASAIEYIAADFDKQAEEPGPGHGPGALHVMQAESSGALSHDAGHGHNIVPMHTGMQAAHQSGGSKTQVPNDQDHAPGGPGHQTTAMSGGKGKTAGVIRQAFQKEAVGLQGMGAHAMGHDAPDGADAQDMMHAIRKSHEAKSMKPQPSHAPRTATHDLSGVRSGTTLHEMGHVPVGGSGTKIPFGVRAKLKARLAAGAVVDYAKKHPGRVGGAAAGVAAVGAGAAALHHNKKKTAESTAADEAEESEGMSEAARGLAKARAAHESEKSEKKASLANLARGFQVKLADDANNPAHISAGKDVPPDTSSSGESGGAPVAGMPQGPRGLVHSNESAMNYKRNAAYGGRKSELKEYFNEPALTMSTDKTLSAAFDHTSQAGTKFASAGGGSTKVAAARAILSKLAEEAEAKSVKDKGEKGTGAGASQ